jgi:hypothetical protein
LSEQPPSEEELRARLEEELKKITVEDVLLQTAVTLVNLGGQRLGLTPETQEARDLGQTRVAIEAVRALMPLLEERGDMVSPLRDALAQLQLAYAQEAEAPAGAAGEGGEEAKPETPAEPPAAGERERPPGKGRLWTPPGSSG